MGQNDEMADARVSQFAMIKVTVQKLKHILCIKQFREFTHDTNERLHLIKYTKSSHIFDQERIYCTQAHVRAILPS